MAAAKRRSGNGLVIALVVFIVLSLTGIGVSIWLFQQKAMVEQAVAAQQNNFEDQVGTVFKKEKWNLSTRPEATFGFRYGEDAFSEVRSKLLDAALLEDIRPLIGWNSPKAIKNRLDNSPAQQEQSDPYKRISGLLGFYEQEYERLNEQVSELNAELDNVRTKLSDKTEAMNTMQNRLMQEKTDAVEKYKNDIADLREQYKEMQQQYNASDKQLQQWKSKFDKSQKQWQQTVGKVRQKAANWEQLYQQATAEEEVVEELQPAGTILDVEPRYEFIVVEGGDDSERQKGQNLVLYTRSPSGVRTVKGKAVINNVYDTTSLATIVGTSAQLMEGDFFVPEQTWTRHQKDQQMAEAEKPTTTVKPPVSEKPAPTTDEPEETGETTTEEPTETPEDATTDEDPTDTTTIDDEPDEGTETEDDEDDFDFSF